MKNLLFFLFLTPNIVLAEIILSSPQDQDWIVMHDANQKPFDILGEVKGARPNSQVQLEILNKKWTTKLDKMNKFKFSIDESIFTMYKDDDLKFSVILNNKTIESKKIKIFCCSEENGLMELVKIGKAQTIEFKKIGTPLTGASISIPEGIVKKDGHVFIVTSVNDMADIPTDKYSALGVAVSFVLNAQTQNIDKKKLTYRLPLDWKTTRSSLGFKRSINEWENYFNRNWIEPSFKKSKVVVLGHTNIQNAEWKEIAPTNLTEKYVEFETDSLTEFDKFVAVFVLPDKPK